MTMQKPCLRCLLSEMPEEAVLARNLRELIALIPEADRASAETVEERLQTCRECDHLSRGTCRLCGCYVEHRAAKLRGACPAVPTKWSV